MPANKNAMMRYKLLDELLSDRHHYYDIHDLTDKVNEQLLNAGFEAVSRRSIEKDLDFMTYWPCNAPIEHRYRDFRHIISYSEPGFSIFQKKLSKDEKQLLSETLNTLGQFDGLENFEWLDGLRHLVGAEKGDGRKIICFSHNPDFDMVNSELLGRLFSVISNKVVIDIKYHTFQNHEVRETCVHPYMLKQYNGRGFLLAGADKDSFILNFPLDRINDFKPNPGKEYRECSEDLTDRLENIVGVSIPKDAVEKDILLWVSDHDYPYIATKPLHGTQKEVRPDEVDALREKYGFTDGHFIRISCIVNYELKRLLASFFEELIVLEPRELRNDIASRLKEMNNRYQ